MSKPTVKRLLSFGKHKLVLVIVYTDMVGFTGGIVFLPPLILFVRIWRHVFQFQWQHSSWVL